MVVSGARVAYARKLGIPQSPDLYEELMHETFDNVETIRHSQFAKLFDPNYMQNAASNNEVISVHFKGHADNVRSLKVFTREPSLNTLTFRESSFNFSINDKLIVYNFFRIFH